MCNKDRERKLTQCILLVLETLIDILNTHYTPSMVSLKYILCLKLFKKSIEIDKEYIAQYILLMIEHTIKLIYNLVGKTIIIDFFFKLCRLMV